MARSKRAEVFAADEIAVVHVMNRVVRRACLIGRDPFTGKNYDHRKKWIESELARLAAGFGIDLLAFAVLSNHFHLVLRSRPDVVATWNNTEVARRWLHLCPGPKRKRQGQRPTEPELNSIRNNKHKLKEIRSRLSDISWWMRLVCQHVAQWANAEDGTKGKFWEDRYKAVRLLDEDAILACAAYVDLNAIRAAIAETLEMSDSTSAQRRIQALNAPPVSAELGEESVTAGDLGKDSSSADEAITNPAFQEHSHLADRSLSPVEITEQQGPLATRSSSTSTRCSDKGFLAMSTIDYLKLLDWTARHIVPGKLGSTPEHAPPILERLSIKPVVWIALVTRFGELFSLVAGRPQVVDRTRSRLRKNRYHLRRAARELLTAQADGDNAASALEQP